MPCLMIVQIDNIVSRFDVTNMKFTLNEPERVTILDKYKYILFLFILQTKMFKNKIDYFLIAFLDIARLYRDYQEQQ